MQHVRIRLRLLAAPLLFSLLLPGCKPFGLHKKPPEDTETKSDEEKTTKKSRWDFLNNLRDDRALEVERHLGP
jgi:hypothetical protein